MQTDSLRTNELSDDAYAWYLEYLTDLDVNDIDAYDGACPTTWS